MMHFSKYDIVVIKFPFASSLKYKARPAVILSSEVYNTSKRDTLLVCAISSQTNSKLSFEENIENWKDAGLLKESIFKSAIVTVEKEYILQKLGILSNEDRRKLNKMIEIIC